MKVSVSFQLDYSEEADRSVLNFTRALIMNVYKHIRDMEYRRALVAASELHLLPSDIAVLTTAEYEDVFDIDAIAKYGQVCLLCFDKCGCDGKHGPISSTNWAADRVHLIRDFLLGRNDHDLTFFRPVRLSYDPYTLACHERLIASMKAAGQLSYGQWADPLKTAMQELRGSYPGYTAVTNAAFNKTNIALEVDKLNEKHGGKPSASYSDRFDLYGITMFRRANEASNL
jgi:hypothetical protein